MKDASGVHPLAAETRGEPVEADVSRGPAGKPEIIVAQTRAIYSLDPQTGSRRRLHTTHDVARSPVLWGNRIAWIEGRDRVYTAVLGHKAKRVPMPRGRSRAISCSTGVLAIVLNSGVTLGDAQV